jgi:hypothetical protein
LTAKPQDHPQAAPRVLVASPPVSDYDGCTEMIDAMAKRFPQARYRCVPAN